MPQASTFVTSPLALTGTTVDTFYPSLTGLAGGRTAVVWTEESNEAIWLSLLDASGQPEGDPVRVTTPGQDANRPAVVELENGNIFVTYTDLSTSSRVPISGRVFSPDGTPLGESQVVFHSAANSSVAPSSSALSAGGAATVFTNLGLDGSLYGVYFQLTDANGTPVGGVQRVNQTTSSFQSFGEVTSLQDGGFVVTWQSRNVDGSSYAVMMRGYNADGTARSNEIRVNQYTLFSQRDPEITELSDGRYIISWTSYFQDSSGNGVYARIYNADGTAATNEFRVNSTTRQDQQSSSVASLPDGGFIVAWVHQVSSREYEVRYQEFDAQGNRVGEEAILSDGPLDVSAGIVLSAGEDGTVRAIWLNGDQGDRGFTLFTAALNQGTEGTEQSEALSGSANADYLFGLGGADTIAGEAGDDRLDGGAGADLLNGGSGNDSLFGGSGRDSLRGDIGNDSLTGGTGDDTLYGGDGDDRLFGNTSLDTLYGGAGNDYISAGDGVDFVNGDAGNDTIHGRSGWDLLNGNDGNDSIYGSQGDDTLNGGGDDDWLSGGSAWDVLFGNDGNDTLYGNFGSDVQSGGAGNDQLFGGTGDDSLRGGDGNDTLQGNQGVDRLDGGAGDDLLRGGTLRDTFVFNTGYDNDEINDFEEHRDFLLLSTSLTGGETSAANILSTYGSVVNGQVVFDFGNGDVLTLSNLSTLSGLEDNINTF
ncbi:type I secretion target repeat protein [Roseobacter sp. SK209-2-6]|uniref:calcium-binding protein n=1 Tax=Roseobacter sp. SK209-2-6 TaxID=388739 RepID=UPI0000F3C1D0|nr:calcium-binding protein [Roseobacter sp. SK209-2-6]EBA15319.1 type I secretion target repeat protein [Roseobacter sp. SK209-2-6]